MSAVSPESMVAAFEDLGLDIDDPKVIDLLTSFCDIYKMNEDKISTEVMAFMYRKKLSTTASPTSDLLQDFEREVLKHLEERRARDATRKIVDVTNLLCDDEDVDDAMMLSYNVKTPSRGSEKRQISPETGVARKRGTASSIFSPGSYKGDDSTPNSRKYQSRQNAGSTMITFGDGRIADWKVEKHLYKACVKTYKALDEPYRFMFEGLRDKAGHLDESICRVGDIIAKNHGLEEPQDFVQTLPDPVVCLGRVCCDSADGRLNVHSILLQGSQDICNGKSIPFEPSRVADYSLFPGQIILTDAVNPNGARLLASKIYHDASPQLVEQRDHVKDSPLSVVFASGPFTTSDNLGYQPLSDFLKYIVTNKPHVAILTGPFVDEKHELIEMGKIEESFQKIFDRVLGMIAEATKDLLTQIVIVPSSRDVHHIPIYPTPPFPGILAGNELPSNIHMFSDPCLIDIEGVIFGITSTDILFHMGKEEISFPPRSGDRLRRIATHLLQQRSFYPLYPPAEEINLDVERLESHAQLTVQPHVLVLPSDLLHFFKDVNGGLVMNPSRLTKREGGGVFARLLIHPNLGEETFVKRVQGEIVRI